jgi:hypothetical protein
VIDRRSFIGSLAVMVLAPLVTEVQQHGRAYRIGFLSPHSVGDEVIRLSAFREGLKELGYAEGQNLGRRTPVMPKEMSAGSPNSRATL